MIRGKVFNKRISFSMAVFFILSIIMFLSNIILLRHAEKVTGYKFLKIVIIIVVFVYIIAAVGYIKNAFFEIIDMERKISVLQKEYDDKDKSVGRKRKESMVIMDSIKALLQREANANMMWKEAEIVALQNQINPHFLYNTLEMIRGQALVKKDYQIADTTKALADIFRYNISKKGKMVTLKEELDNIEAYMYIQSIRFNNRFSMSLKVDDDVLDLKIPKLIIQPVVENALKHGLEKKKGNGKICIEAFRSEDAIFINVNDNGVGMDESTKEKVYQRLQGKNKEDDVKGNSTHVGLENIKERIKMIYGENYGVSFESTAGVGTKVHMVIGIIE